MLTSSLSEIDRKTYIVICLLSGTINYYTIQLLEAQGRLYYALVLCYSTDA